MNSLIVRPTSQRESYSPQNEVRFALPDAGMLAKGLRFSGTINVTDASPHSTSEGPVGNVGYHSLIEEISVISPKFGILERLTHYGRLAMSLLANSTSVVESATDDYYSGGRANAGSSHNTLVNTLNGSNTFSFTPLCGAFGVDMPLEMLGGIEVVVRLTSNANFFYEPSTTGLEFTLSDVSLDGNIMESSTPSKAISFHSYQSQVVTLNAGRQTISTKVPGMCDRYFASFLPTGSVNSEAANFYEFADPEVTSVQFRIGGRTAPVMYKLSNSQDIRENFQHAAGGARAIDSGANLSTGIGCSFGVPQDLSALPFSAEIVSSADASTTYSAYQSFRTLVTISAAAN